MSQPPELDSPSLSWLMRSAIRTCEKLVEENVNGELSGREPAATLPGLAWNLAKCVSATVACAVVAITRSIATTIKLEIFCLNMAWKLIIEQPSQLKSTAALSLVLN